VKGIWREGHGRAPIKGRTRHAALGPLATLAVALRASTNTPASTGNFLKACASPPLPCIRNHKVIFHRIGLRA